MSPAKQNDADRQQERPQDRAPGLGSMMQEVLHKLGDIDVEYEIWLDQVEHSRADQELKEHLKKKIRAAHRERREPYENLLISLRQREHRLSLDS
jgi:hypothetical protein